MRSVIGLFVCVFSVCGAEGSTAFVLSPSAGAGRAVRLRIEVRQPDVSATLASMQVLIGDKIKSAYTCTIHHTIGTDSVMLASDTGSQWTTPVVFGTETAASNAQCTLQAAPSSAVASADVYTLTLDLAFTGAFSGARNVWVRVADRSALGYRNWVQSGSWIVSGPAWPDEEWIASELEKRPQMSPDYLPGFAAAIDAAGKLRAVAGQKEDCVRVDGSTGPCGLRQRTQRWKFEVEGHAKLTLIEQPATTANVSVYRNGLLLAPPEDYVVDGSTVELDVSTEDIIQAVYFVSGNVLLQTPVTEVITHLP